MARRKISGPEPYELDEATAARVASMIEAADREVGEERVNVRWTHSSLEVIRKAARLHGVPYQTYIKQVAFRQAVTDLKDAAAAGVTAGDR